MTSPDEPAENARRWQWLDRWFVVRWRAVLTWVVLAGVSGAVFDKQAIHWVVDGFRQLIARLGVTLPGILLEIIKVCHVLVVFTWFQPVVLRLNLLRSLIWFAVCGMPGAAILIPLQTTALRQWQEIFVFMLILTAGPAIGGIVLIGWRSRAWMSVVAATLSAITLGCLPALWRGSIGSGPAWLVLVAVNFPYALVMLYGTKPLVR